MPGRAPGPELALPFEATPSTSKSPCAGGIVEALAPCRTPSGSYRLDNEFHFLIASA